MQEFRRAINAAIGDQLVFKHFIVDLDAGEVCEQRSACQDMIEHLRTTVMQHGKATVGRQRTLDRVSTRPAKRPDPVSSSPAQASRSAVSWSSALKSPQTAIRASGSASNTHSMARRNSSACPARLLAAAKKPSAQPDTVFQANGPVFCPGTAAASGARK